MYRRISPRSVFGPLLFLSLLVVLLFFYRPQKRSEIIAPETMPGKIFPQLDEVRQKQFHSQSQSFPSLEQKPKEIELTITSAEGLYDSAEQTLLKHDIEEVTQYASERFGAKPFGRITISLEKESVCNLNGVAYTDERQIQIFTCTDYPRQRTINILAHEFVHQLAHDTYGKAHLQADLILAEGLATWGAGKYWLGGLPDFRAFVQKHYLSKELLPLATPYSGRSIYDMNKLYYEWASFVEFLLERYGREAFDALYCTGNNEPGSAHYQQIYGKSLSTLEQEWQAWLSQRS